VNAFWSYIFADNPINSKVTWFLQVEQPTLLKWQILLQIITIFYFYTINLYNIGHFWYLLNILLVFRGLKMARGHNSQTIHLIALYFIFYLYSRKLTLIFTLMSKTFQLFLSQSRETVFRSLQSGKNDTYIPPSCPIKAYLQEMIK
jgi:hypothetical protein